VAEEPNTVLERLSDADDSILDNSPPPPPATDSEKLLETSKNQGSTQVTKSEQTTFHEWAASETVETHPLQVDDSSFPKANFVENQWRRLAEGRAGRLRKAGKNAGVAALGRRHGSLRFNESRRPIEKVGSSIRKAEFEKHKKDEEVAKKDVEINDFKRRLSEGLAEKDIEVKNIEKRLVDEMTKEDMEAKKLERCVAEETAKIHIEVKHLEKRLVRELAEKDTKIKNLGRRLSEQSARLSDKDL
jgi:hypothetical protein